MSGARGWKANRTLHRQRTSALDGNAIEPITVRHGAAAFLIAEGVPGSAGQFMAGDERGQPVGIIADTDQEM